MIRIFRAGAHVRRMPLSYPSLAPLFADWAVFTQHARDADLAVFAHSLDVEAAPEALIEAWRARRLPIAILSEEPFWDTLWGRRPLARTRMIETWAGALPVTQINHQTSPVFAFARIPYYLLSDHRFASAYGARFARNAGRTASGWAADFAARPRDLSFQFERRPEAHHNVHWPEGDVIGLCAWRTELATACTGTRVERLGQSWGARASRFDLDNWHLDKLVHLDGRARMIGAIENTHQPHYLSEKLFDAFACGALPLYYATNAHRVHDLGLPGEAWLNLAGLSPAAAADKVAAFRFDKGFFAAFAEAQQVLAALFCDPANWVEERARLAAALKAELEGLLDTRKAA